MEYQLLLFFFPIIFPEHLLSAYFCRHNSTDLLVVISLSNLTKHYKNTKSQDTLYQ